MYIQTMQLVNAVLEFNKIVMMNRIDQYVEGVKVC